MEANLKSSFANKGQSKCSSSSDAETKVTSEKSSIFVNHAAIAWNENRRKWIGDQSLKSKTVPREPVICWSMDYDDLLSTNAPFSKPIPLTEMVDFLVDIWYDEGLYDC